MKIISPDFLTSRLNVFEEDPCPAEVTGSALPEVDAPSAAANLVVEGMGAEVVSRQETPASESEAGVEDFILERRPSTARTETAEGVEPGQEAAAGASAEASEGSPRMAVLG